MCRELVHNGDHESDQEIIIVVKGDGPVLRLDPEARCSSEVFRLRYYIATHMVLFGVGLGREVCRTCSIMGVCHREQYAGGSLIWSRRGKLR